VRSFKTLKEGDVIIGYDNIFLLLEGTLADYWDILILQTDEPVWLDELRCFTAGAVLSSWLPKDNHIPSHYKIFHNDSLLSTTG